MKRVKLWIVLVVLAGCGGGVWYYLTRVKTTKPAVVPTVTAVRRGDLKVFVSATGAVEPEFTVEIKSKASGQVRAIRVEVGDYVKKGALLVEIDPLTERRKLTQAVASLRMAEAKRGSTTLKLRYSRSRLKRDEALHKKGLVSRDAIDTLRKEAAVLAGDLQISNAEILKARSSHKEAKDRLTETKILAPIKGTVLTRSVQPGQMISSATSGASGGSTLLKIADLEQLFVRVKIDEADIAKLKAGQPAQITADALPGFSFKGEVLRIAPQGTVESNVTVFDVIVKVGPEDCKFLRPMLTANIEILTASAENALLVPRAAVRGRGKRSFVKLEDGTRQRVKLGLTSGKDVQVLSGLTNGARVIVPGPGATKKPGGARKKRSVTDPRSLRRVMGGKGKR